MRKAEVTPYNKSWPKMFEKEASKLHAVFGSEIIQIHHVGSTSVKGLKAKPVIDIMPVVKSISRIDEYNAAMIDIGYEPKGENGIQGRRFYQKGGDERTHHVHVYESGSSNIERHLAFRDYLRTYPEALKKYADLKEELSKRFLYDVASYTKEKGQLVSEIESKAVIWYQNLK
ncbi:GrpB family protein [Virgibacillus sp. NKC19-16]|uniref:GrpB family protein n=1 Tax=Virgibacillus salidurans TaxID=2831673 RepID=UPI001F2F91C2|nr:GrpB family protein [Virgibacillus sp. NKC19-16]UJL47099.1 GrpB family protein [Virgibacillus sp. NKC19-16]